MTGPDQADDDDASDAPLDSLLAAVARIPARDLDRDWTPPAELDEYRMIRPLGRGGMGSVWLAEDTLLDRLVAVKFIAHAEPDKHTRERFAIEARAAARLQHLNVVTVHRYGELAGRPYLVSEYIRGESLDKLAKPVPWQRSLELGIALARGLAAAHRHGIVHRDIKPANAILTALGDAKLVDFGLAKLGNADVLAVPASTPATGDDDTGLLTAPGTIAGTPRYLAPEVRRGEPAGRRSDVYQLGCILYELVIGCAPSLDLARPTAASTLDAGESSSDGALPPRILARHELDIPSLVDRPGWKRDRDGARFAAVVDRCLRRNPEDRFASGDELREALEAIAAPAVGGELPDGNPYRGLVAFEAEHRALFFGRGADIRAVIERLRADPFVLVTGDSGVGKSSLCRAGVLPHVADGAFGDGIAWSIVRLVPGQRPLTTLAGLLAPLAGLDEPELFAVLRDEPMRLGRELRRVQGTTRGLLLFVDQLEEVTTIADRDEADAFGHVLGQLAAGTPGVRVLATVRSDFLTRLAEVPSIGAELARALFVLRPLSAEAAREAVLGPARAKGARFESEELVETLVASVASSGAMVDLPLLAFTLAQLWDARDPSTQTISARSLDAIGGVRGALARHADGVLDHLLPAQRIVARKLLLRLVTPERTRVRRNADELVAFDRQALDALVRGRLVVARASRNADTDDTPTYELAHERLIDGWPALSGWLSETTEAIAVHARLATAVTDWGRLEHARDGLWGERQLADLALLPAEDLTAAETRFVVASRRAMRRRRVLRAALVLAIPLALATFYVGARVVAQRDLDRHVAANVGEADRERAIARTASAASEQLRLEALARFDAGDAAQGEDRWEASRQRSAEAQAAYTRTARAYEAAFLVDTERDDVRRSLAEVTFERLQLAAREYRDSERRELVTPLSLYDRDGEFSPKLVAPARLTVTVSPADATLMIATPDRERPLIEPSLAPGSYILVARAPGRTTVRYPILLEPGSDRRVALALPPASSIPPGLVYIAAGPFLSGSREDDVIRRFNGSPPMHELDTPAFLIGRTEVTYAQWIELLDDLPPGEREARTPHIERAANAHDAGTLELRRIAGTWELHMKPASLPYEARAGSPIEYRDRTARRRQDWLQFPVSGISPEDAQAYAAWLDRTGRVKHARLCTGREWEKASRGADGRSYPHGDKLAPEDANIDVTYGRRDGGYGPDVVGSHPASTSPYGLVDVVGNVWEILREPAGTFAMRGGSYYQTARVAHVANREVIPPAFRHPQTGLRICADL